MKTARFTMTALLVSAALVFVSCKDSAPVGPAANGVVQVDFSGNAARGSGTDANSLLACSALPTSSVRQTVGPAGGVIRIGPHTLTIPEGSLKKSVTITAVAPSGRVNHVDFGPEGLEFRKPATLTMSYANCSLVASLLPKRIAYTDEDLTKIYYFLIGVDDVLNKRVSSRLDHFSDYVMAW